MRQFAVACAFALIYFCSNASASVAPGTLSAESAALIAEQRESLAEQKFVPWIWQTSTCVDCEIAILPTSAAVRTPKVMAFINALADRKSELIRLYQSNGAEYNLLARMAIGILGRESQFFESRRYKTKETFPWAVHLLKLMRVYLEGVDRDPSPNSRGPTQIKIVPTKIVEHYGITASTLNEPESAAIATMGFLIEALHELKTRIRVNHLDFVNASNYVDYLPYIYFGSTKTLVSGRADPAQSQYIRDMKTYMEWVEIYERAPVIPVL